MAMVKAQTVSDVVAEIELKQSSFLAKHISGLPLHEGIECRVIFKDDGIVIKAEKGGSQQFRLAYNKIVDFQIPCKKNVQNTMVSSAGGAVAGAMLFGAPGAMVGGRARRQEIVKFEYSFIVTYKKDDDLADLYFHLDNGNLNAVNLVKKYKHLTACPAPGEVPVVDL